MRSSKIVNSMLISLLMSLIQRRRYIKICQIKIYYCLWNPPRWNNSAKFVFIRKKHPNKLRSHLHSGDISSRWDIVPCWFFSYISSHIQWHETPPFIPICLLFFIMFQQFLLSSIFMFILRHPDIIYFCNSCRNREIPFYLFLIIYYSPFLHGRGVLYFKSCCKV